MPKGVRPPLVKAVGKVKRLQAKLFRSTRDYEVIEYQLKEAIQELLNEINKCCVVADVGLNVIEYVKVIVPPYTTVSIHMPAEIINVNCVPVYVLRNNEHLITLSVTRTKIPWTRISNPPCYVINPSSKEMTFYVRRITVPV